MVKFAKFFTLRERRRSSDTSLLRVRGSTLQRHPFRLVSEDLRILQRYGNPCMTDLISPDCIKLRGDFNAEELAEPPGDLEHSTPDGQYQNGHFSPEYNCWICGPRFQTMITRVVRTETKSASDIIRFNPPSFLSVAEGISKETSLAKRLTSPIHRLSLRDTAL